MNTIRLPFALIPLLPALLLSPLALGCQETPASESEAPAEPIAPAEPPKADEAPAQPAPSEPDPAPSPEETAKPSDPPPAAEAKVQEKPAPEVPTPAATPKKPKAESATQPLAKGESKPAAPKHALSDKPASDGTGTASTTPPTERAETAPSAGSAAAAKTFHVREGGPSRIAFASDAPLEKISGSSGKIGGAVTFDPNDLSKASGRIEVPVATLNTGLALRDEHLHSDKWLDAKKHPTIVFEILAVEGAPKLEANKPTKLKVRGRLTVHGVTRPKVATAVVKLVPHAGGDVLQTKAQFTVKLGDHDVAIPAIVKMKVAEDIQVNATIEAVAR